MARWLRRFQADIYYDGWCPLCSGVKNRIERLDWLGLIRFVSIRADGTAESLGIPSAVLERRMHARIASSGRILDGIDAAAVIASRVPLFTPLWPLLVLAGWIGLGQWGYDLIASRRTIVPVGQCASDYCPVHRGDGDDKKAP